MLSKLALWMSVAPLLFAPYRSAFLRVYIPVEQTGSVEGVVEDISNAARDLGVASVVAIILSIVAVAVVIALIVILWRFGSPLVAQMQQVMGNYQTNVTELQRITRESYSEREQTRRELSANTDTIRGMAAKFSTSIEAVVAQSGKSMESLVTEHRTTAENTNRIWGARMDGMELNMTNALNNATALIIAELRKEVGALKQDMGTLQQKVGTLESTSVTDHQVMDEFRHQIDGISGRIERIEGTLGTLTLHEEPTSPLIPSADDAPAASAAPAAPAAAPDQETPTDELPSPPPAARE